jgi:hypothetical protein
MVQAHDGREVNKRCVVAQHAWQGRRFALPLHPSRTHLEKRLVAKAPQMTVERVLVFGVVEGRPIQPHPRHGPRAGTAAGHFPAPQDRRSNFVLEAAIRAAVWVDPTDRVPRQVTGGRVSELKRRWFWQRRESA